MDLHTLTAPARAEETEEEKREHVRRIIADFKDHEGSLIQILHMVQSVYGYLPFEIQQLPRFSPPDEFT